MQFKGNRVIVLLMGELDVTDGEGSLPFYQRIGTI